MVRDPSSCEQVTFRSIHAIAVTWRRPQRSARVRSPTPARMSQIRPPWIRAVTKPGAMVFAIMFALESLARATLWTIVPLQAYALLADVRDVSLLNTGVSLFGMIGGLTMPLLIRALRRRWVYSLGVVLAAAAGMLLATGTL